MLQIRGDPGRNTIAAAPFQEEYREFLRKHGVEYDENVMRGIEATPPAESRFQRPLEAVSIPGALPQAGNEAAPLALNEILAGPLELTVERFRNAGSSDPGYNHAPFHQKTPLWPSTSCGCRPAISVDVSRSDLLQHIVNPVAERMPPFRGD